MEMSNDKLDMIFTMQKALNDDIIARRNLQDITDEEWIQKHMLAMLSEMAEVLDEVNFKWWKNPHELNKANIHEELSDILHFFISMCLEAGMTAEDLYNVYVGKNKENHDRQDGKSQKHGYETGLNA